MFRLIGLTKATATAIPPPVTLAQQELGKYIASCLPKHIQQFSVYKDELVLNVAPKSLLPTLNFLKLHQATQFAQLVEIAGVDYPTKANRFELVYCLLSLQFNNRIIVKTFADEVSPVPSVTGIYKGANWMEREVYGTTGYVEVRYDDAKKRVVAEPLELAQAFRMEQTGAGKDVPKALPVKEEAKPDTTDKKK
ncbi:hypothetical protein HDV02_005717 [Globomyces sp. JEL0801]|nr:hypothetical protein HDV02_005717 [Globomyces sp. JEL0801]